MNGQKRLATMVSTIFIVTLMAVGLVACSTTSPGPSPSKSASSPAASSPAPSPAASSASPSAKPASAEEQAYQKAQENWKKVVEAARTEGTAVLYAIQEEVILRMFESEFNKIDPKIQIKLMRATGAAATEKLRAEAATKQITVNGYVGGSTSVRNMAAAGLGQVIDDLPALYEPGVKWAVPALMDKGQPTFTYAVNRTFVMINTNLVPPGQEPKTWKDLGDPKWKDKLVLWDPRLSGMGQSSLSLLYHSPEHGPEVVRTIVENTRVVSDGTQAARAVATGEAAMTMSALSNYEAVKDAPVKMLGPADGTLATPLQFLIVKNAPQLNVMKVYLNWIMSKEGQKVVGRQYSILRGDVDGVSPEAQLVGQKMVPGVPASWDFDMGQAKAALAVFGKWLDELGR